MARVRQPAPLFKAASWYRNEFKEIDLRSYQDRYVLIFFYPLNFTSVCLSEVNAFNDRIKDFQDLDCEIIGISIDSKFSHKEYTLKSKENGGTGPLEIPLVSDMKKDIARAYGCLCEEPGDFDGTAFRGTYLIDKQGIMRYISVGDFQVGRTVEDFLRIVKTFKFSDDNKGQLCMANWKGAK